ncbi:MAG: YfhO family protein [Chloroflexi bacterium]|nr:YfhO family protein [Chloroflexota bacterium]
MVIQRADLLATAALLILPWLWFNRVLLPTLTGRTLLPFDNLYAFEPWHSLRPDVQPYNPLISDLVLESVPWVLHTRQALAAGEVPFWNADVLSGVAFMAGGQAGVIYPFSVLLYALPVADGFGWFIALHLSLAGLGMFMLGRTLGLRRMAALLGGVAGMFGGYFITSATFPDAISAAAWTPWLLAIVERLIRRKVEHSRAATGSAGLWLLGTVCVGLSLLAGHAETSFYGLLTVAAYATVRLAVAMGSGARGRAAWTGVILAAMFVLGAGLAAVLLVPMAEGLAASARLVVSATGNPSQLAWPLPQLWTLVLPDMFGNPTHRHWLDLANFAWKPTPTGEPIFWGTKNYVEGGQYLGLLTLVLAGVGLLHGPRVPAAIFGAIACISLLLVIGSPLYLLLRVVPGAEQLRSPFRLVFPFTVAMCLLAGLGLDVLLRGRPPQYLWLAPLGLGLLTLASVVLSVMLPMPFLQLSQQLLVDPALAERAFGPAGRQLPTALPTAEMFWGYESQGLIRLGLASVACAGVIRLVRHKPQLGAGAAIGLVIVDLFSVHGGFFPATASDLSPLVSKPPVIQAVDQLVAGGQPWRFTTFEPDDKKTLLANSGMYYGWQDVRGYDSIVPRQYAAFTRRLGLPDNSLTFNRIAPVMDSTVLGSTLLGMLNVQYVLTEQRIEDPGYREVYRDAHIAAYQNAIALPRSLIAPLARVLPIDQQPLQQTDLRDVVYLDADPGLDLAEGSRGTSEVRHYGANEVDLDVHLGGPGWVVLTDAFAPGWHATATQTASGSRVDLPVYRADSAFRAVHLASGGAWRVHFWYLPDSLVLGIVISGLSSAVLLAVGLAAVRARLSG